MDRRYETEDDRYGRGYDYGRGREAGGRRYGDSYGYGRRDFEGGGMGRGYYTERGYGAPGPGRADYGGRRSYDFGGYSNERFDRGDERDYGRGDERDYGGYGRAREGDYGYDPGYGITLGRNYGRGWDYDRDYDRGRDTRGYDYEERDERGYGRGDRGWWERTSDEVASWFGDEGAERRRRLDERREGPHRGRGPKNYRRSDSRIEEDVNDRLSDYPFLDASDIEVKVENAEVALTGTVNSRRDKRLAEDIAESVSGVENVENRIRVEREDRGTTTARGSDAAAGAGATRAAAAGATTTTGAATGTATGSRTRTAT